MSYVPFLKYKVNEISAVKELSIVDKRRITPFFDLPRRDVLDSATLKKNIDSAHRKYEINLKSLTFFYIDNFDINDSILINDDDNYAYVLEKFSDAKIVPVVGIDRSERRNEVVVEAKDNDMLLLDTVALRVSYEDIISYTLVEDEIKELIDSLDGHFNDYHLIIDNRVCHNIDVDVRAAQIIQFIDDICEDIDFDKVIVTGSSIPASIRELLEPNSTITIDRPEIKVFNKVLSSHPFVVIGDYTAVSPNYSDVKIMGEIMRRVTAPKMMYSFENKLHIQRGGALEGHPRGNKQYNDLSVILINEPFFRNSTYSFGDKYIDEKANNVGKDSSPSTIPKALINAHMTYMLNDFI
jgi:hypothetical protein